MKNFIGYKKINLKKIQNKSGFTLVEMMVAVFIFSVVMMLATGAIFNIVNANKTSQALKSVMDNLSSALDSMSREIRYGTNYHCGSSGDKTVPASCDSSGSNYFSFLEKNDLETITYKFQAYDSVTDGSGYIERCVDSGSGDVCSLLTAPEVHITKLYFYVQGAQNNENQQPQLLITISGYAKAGPNKSYFDIETMVDQRRLTMCKDSLPEYLKVGLSCPQ